MFQVNYFSGPPLLLKATMDAVRQWKYQPTLLSGKAAELNKTVSIVFTLGKEP